MHIKNTFRKQFITLVHNEQILSEDIDEALIVSNVMPTQKSWKLFLNTLFLWMGGLLLASGLLFFVAYNWNMLGKFIQFLLIEFSLIMSIFFYYRLDETHIGSKVSLMVASILVGVLLALFGQTYQTGADTWQLFFYWAVLISPWAVIGRFSALWILVIALLNLSIYLYNDLFRGFFWHIFDMETLIWSLFGFNTLVLLLWEIASKYSKWPEDIWSTELIAIASGTAVTFLLLMHIDKREGILPFIVWIFYMTTIYLFYRRYKPNLFILAGWCLSIIVVIITFFSIHIIHVRSASSFLFLALLVMGLGTLSTLWLKRTYKELNA